MVSLDLESKESWPLDSQVHSRSRSEWDHSPIVSIYRHYCVHNVFHVSMLRKYEPDPSHIVMWSEIPIRGDLTYEEHPIMILERELKILRRREIPLVKVLWQHHGAEEATWELESEMREKYPFLL